RGGDIHGSDPSPCRSHCLACSLWRTVELHYRAERRRESYRAPEDAATTDSSSSFFSWACATLAVSGRYFPSRMLSAWPSWLTMKRRNSRTPGSIGWLG